jgi:hypothetical protein
LPDTLRTALALGNALELLGDYQGSFLVDLPRGAPMLLA